MFSFSTRSVFGLLAAGVLSLSVSGCIEEPGSDVGDDDVDVQLEQSADGLVVEDPAMGVEDTGVNAGVDPASPADNVVFGNRAAEQHSDGPSFDGALNKDPEPAPWEPPHS